ncbi:MAG: DEAD/DEAH box helicase family protein [Phormidesmis sp. CAN_BIN44]|nr:DEAD/DEAH box helicase family protein [Phormidesmis sp. CAN_BIN44]
MNRHVNAISGRLSLRPPQQQSLEILSRICEILPPKKGTDLAAGLAAIQSEFPTVTNFEREFPSLCFSLATGVGKTRLMGAFISYLYLAHGIKNFFVLAPNLTIYDKLITDFTPNTPKYVLKGISEFATEAPEMITGDNYQNRGRLLDELTRCKINVFNISKINSEVRGGKSPRIKQLSEYIGDSYFNYLAGLDDLVILMDESHRYRASAGVRAINELKPVLGLELTATPFIETSRGAIPFKNVIYDYPLGRAMADGFVKEPAVVTRKDFNPAGMSAEQIEQLKLEDGVRLHESIKVELETYARETGNAIVKPFILVIARDTTHAAQLVESIQSVTFFEGRYETKVIQVDSSKTGAQEDEMVERLLRVEQNEEPTEIVVHVNMLKEGWDVTNLYTIVPLRAANARILVEQSMGRGLRLPYGKRTGVTTVDRLNIVAHDKFQEIIDMSSQLDSPLRLQQVILTPETLQQTVTLVSQSQLASKLGFQLPQSTTNDQTAPSPAAQATPPIFTSPEEQKIAQIAYGAILRLENRPDTVPTTAHLLSPEVQAMVREAVVREYQPAQLALDGVLVQPDVEAIVAKTTNLVIQETIDIPRILVLPTGEVRSGFRPFTLTLASLNYPPPSDELWIQHLRTNQLEIIGLQKGSVDESRLEDYVVSGLVDFNDIAYDEHSDLLYDLGGQVARHFCTYLSEDDARKVLRLYQRDIARFVHTQMLDHFWEEPVDYEVKISRGFTALKPSAYTTAADESPLDYRQSPTDKSNMAKYLFGGFSKCLYSVQKFQSDTERMLSVILERETIKWFKPAKGQFQIYYRWNGDHPEYQPDFVAESDDVIYMLEPKRRSEMDDAEVIAKKDAAVKWCQQASEYMQSNGGKSWSYVLIPHDAIAQNMTLKGLADRFRVD